MVAKGKPASIKGIHLTNSNETMIPITGIGQPTALDYEAKTNSVIYADSHRMVLEKVSMRNTSERTVLQKNIRGCDGLAVDWLSGNLYWTDQQTGSISVLKLANSTQKRTLFQNRLYNPVSIVLNPLKGIMYWADWSDIFPTKGRIYEANMDGTKFKTFLENDIDWPSGLTIDFNEKRLYWCDRHLVKIESVEFSGQNRRVDFIIPLKNPFSLALGPDKTFFFTLLNQGIVMAYSNKSGLKELDYSNPPIFDIKLFNPDLQTGKCSRISKVIDRWRCV